jgi:predicted glycogen debranching enzyme
MPVANSKLKHFMKAKFDSSQLNNFETARSLEWIETNGLGGYASSTVSGAHSRRYHGLLVAAMHPPVGRTVLLSKLDETLKIGEERYELSANQYPGAVAPKGFNFIKSFERDLFPVFEYEAGGVVLRKTLAAIHGENTTVILYEVVSARKKMEMELMPLCACRDYHSLSHANESIGQPYLFQDGVFRTVNYQGCPEIFISVPGSMFTEDKNWYYNFEYAVEQYRGLDFKEDLYTHGKFSVPLKKGDTLGIIISTDDPTGKDAIELFQTEKKRREQLIKGFGGNKNKQRLALAADQFVVKRGELKTVIAGYHWFADWGRDTMIALPGLCLTTKRYEDAKNILAAFAGSVSQGMLPNRFPDFGEQPEYNTIDATLWYFNAVYLYYKHTNDKDFIISLLPVLKDIIEWHYKGTRYNIHVAEDNLIYGGQDGVQLTWMDAKVGDWVVTPRKGKVVEINALWYNALSIMAYLQKAHGNKNEADEMQRKALAVAMSFKQLFWNEAGHFLYDYVDGDYKNDDLRPNQLYAISLPFPLLTGDRAIKVFDKVTEYLLTPRGLRSVAPYFHDYRPVYGGGVWSRDGAYHQGTVWSFLIGAYIDSLIAIKGEDGKPEATRIINTILEHLDEAGVGTISEIFDAEAPHTSRGCMAQAWGVGEILRVMVEYDLTNSDVCF